MSTTVEDAAVKIDVIPCNAPAPTKALAAFQTRDPHRYRMLVNACIRFLAIRSNGQSISANSFDTAPEDERLLADTFRMSCQDKIVDLVGQFPESDLHHLVFIAARALSGSEGFEAAWFTVLGRIYDYAKTQSLTSLENPAHSNSGRGAYDEFLDSGC